MRRCWWREEVQESQGPRVPRSQGPKDQDILNSHSNTSLTLKKVHLVQILINCKTFKSIYFSKISWRLNLIFVHLTMKIFDTLPD